MLILSWVLPLRADRFWSPSSGYHGEMAGLVVSVELPARLRSLEQHTDDDDDRRLKLAANPPPEKQCSLTSDTMGAFPFRGTIKRTSRTELSAWRLQTQNTRQWAHTMTT
jgi:hypothetical protein